MGFICCFLFVLLQCNKYSWGGCGYHLTALYVGIEKGKLMRISPTPSIIKIGELWARRALVDTSSSINISLYLIQVQEEPNSCGTKGWWSSPITTLLGLFFPNATMIESQQFILLITKVDQLLFLKMGGLFSVFPNLGRKVIKSATNEEICFVIYPSYTRKSKLIKEKKGAAAARKSNQIN